MDLITLALIIVLILVVFGVGPWWPRTRAWGYNPLGILVLIILIVLLLRYV
jgi:hypothetical protein